VEPQAETTVPGDRAAPGAALHLLQDFVNTYDVEEDEDELGTPQLLREWLQERGLLAAAEAVHESERRRAIEIREGLRALGLANNGDPLDESRVAALNRSAAGIPVVVGIGGDDWSLRAASTGVDGFLGQIMATLARAMADGSWSRLKACRNHTCRWLFFDSSRNRSGTWCSMAVCGSRMKARAYRSRQKAAND
jgi:predicted RNA-binding Zn ribbon-like protein